MMKYEILYVEDNEDYVDFVKRAVKKIDTDVTVTAVSDGRKALSSIENMFRTPNYKLIMLDIHMPGITGIEILQKIRSQRNMNFVSIVMLSTSDSPKDIRDSYQSGANAYLVKPVGIQPLTETMRSVCDFWLNRNMTTQN